MNNTQNRPLHTEGKVSDYFIIESHLLSTRSADAFKAIDRRKSQSAIIWMLRFPLGRDSDPVKHFLAKMDSIDSLDPPLSEMTAYGVDAVGIPFTVFPGMNGGSIISGSIEVAEAERRFTWALRSVERLHAAGICCGDICGASFWVERSGEVRLIGLIGGFDAEQLISGMSTNDLQNPTDPGDTKNYLAPEQTSGASGDVRSDVFALGVLGYRLLCGVYPQPAGGGVAAFSSRVPNAPVWADDVLLRALESDPSNRFNSAGEMINAINNCRSATASSQASPARVVRSGQSGALIQQVAPSAVAKSGMAPKPHRESAIEEEAERLALSKRDAAQKELRSALRLMGLGLLCLGGAGYLLFSDMLLPSAPVAQRDQLSLDLMAHRKGAGSEQLRHAIDAIGDESSIAEKAAQLESMANSDDPLAHDILVKSARDAKSDRLRNLSEQAVIDRARRLGLLRSAEQVRQWLRSVKTGQLPSNYESILQSLDTTLPMEARTAALRQSYPANQVLIMRLTAALALDTGKLEEYQPVLGQLVGDSTKDEQAASHSTLGLILGNPELALVFGDDVVQRREQIPDSDVLWLLKILADRNDINVRVMASVAMQRGILSPLRSSHLTLVRDRDDLDPSILAALIRSAAGAVKVEDIASLGRWYDLQSERVLLAICADTVDQTILTEAFDTLAGKSLTIQPSAALVNWIRSNHWDIRGNFAHAVGVLGSADLVDAATIAEALRSFDQFSRDERLLDTLLNNSSSAVVKVIIERYADRLGVGGLIGLLGNPDKNVRLTALKSLKDFNDIGALKLIIDNFERESDPEVKQAYRDTFWVIRQREGAAN